MKWPSVSSSPSSTSTHIEASRRQSPFTSVYRRADTKGLKYDGKVMAIFTPKEVNPVIILLILKTDRFAVAKRRETSLACGTAQGPRIDSKSNPPLET
ncbi:hypothetical protein RRG08_017296 [Elysia crispata]|uniref:Uncharacterized protein n=1 Tax=Elysia crispata TaxID=231223 RepID=A0AAE0Y9M7_9GAST|nr:hypothetical protein RRG08_017296 [Elysia crispata]